MYFANHGKYTAAGGWRNWKTRLPVGGEIGRRGRRGMRPSV